MNFSLGSWSFTLHGYGLLVGLAVVLCQWLAQRRVQAWRDWLALMPSQFERWWWLSLAFGAVGARAWHVVTDWPRYAAQPELIGQLSAGGWSIVGALLTAVLGTGIVARWRARGLEWRQFLDVVSFGLPAGQALGRWGNYLNQELFGWPTSAVWGVAIDPAHRPASWASETHFLPLFAFESVFLVLVAVVWWQRAAVWRRWAQRCPGIVGVSYLSVYAGWRWAVDFLRWDRPVWWLGLSLNQWLALVVGLGGLVWIWYNYEHMIRKTEARLVK